MTNNDILRRLRFALTLSNDELVSIGTLGGLTLDHALIHQWLLKEEDEQYVPCLDSELSQWLDGFIIHRRGKKEDAPAQIIPNRINNNLILRKLRIALDYKEQDMLATFAAADFTLSKSELSALFRKTEHPHYKSCGDQLLRNFVMGLTKRYRDI
jgi:uncharacterized protein YehS (DUF1456 family)